MRWQIPTLAAGRARLVGLRLPLTDVLLAAGVLVIAQVETWMTTSFQPKVVSGHLLDFLLQGQRAQDVGKVWVRANS